MTLDDFILQCASDCVNATPAVVRVGKWTIRYDPPPIPVRNMDYCGVHDDYDGGPMYADDLPSDRRCIRGASVEDVVEQIRELEAEDA